MSTAGILWTWTIVGAVAFFAIGGARGGRWAPGKWIVLAAICGPGMWVAVAGSTLHYAIKTTRLKASVKPPSPAMTPDDALATCAAYHEEQAQHHASMGGHTARVLEARHTAWARAIRGTAR